MSWLTGNQIEKEVEHKRIVIEPFSPIQVNPNSYDYRLDRKLRRLLANAKRGNRKCLDPKREMKWEEITIEDGGFMLMPGEAYLGCTVETFGSNYFASLCTGKSSIGRIFVNNHYCAGLIDQGFEGRITLEISCQMPTIIYPMMRLGQIFWFETVGKSKLYTGKYNKDNAARPSMIYLDIDK